MKFLSLNIFAAVGYVAMVVVNFLANALPINDRTTGAVSDGYPNLFAPAGITFSIWGVIYLQLAGYVVYQFVGKDEKIGGLLKQINPFFIATSLANIFWVFAWHYDYIGVSALLMTGLLILLIRISDILRNQRFNSTQKLFIRTPFSLYFGWITVAAIANITVFLVSIGWNGWGIADYVWTSIILVVGALIGVLRMLKDENIAYGLVLLWAYLGILYKHLSPQGFGGEYPNIIATVILCLGFFAFFVGKLLLKKNMAKQG